MNNDKAAWEEEKSNLAQFESNIDQKIRSLERDRENTTEALHRDNSEDQEKWKVYSDTYKSNQINNERIQELFDIADNPYFGRIDLESKDGKEVFYLGKTRPSLDVGINIIPWFSDTEFRAALLHHFHTTDISDFEANGCHYSINLKRHISISHRLLQSVYNDFDRNQTDKNNITDSFLVELLEQHHVDPFFLDIISSIQEKQYNVIRASYDENLLVQGCAGSGKTQIMLHRLSYLLQSKKPIDWANTVIVTSNPLFKFFAKNLMRSLLVSDIRCITIDDYMYELLSSVQKIDQTGTPSYQSRYSLPQSNMALPSAYLQEINSDNFQKALRDKILVLMELRMAEIEHEHADILQQFAIQINPNSSFSQRIDLLNQHIQRLIPSKQKINEQDHLKNKIAELQNELDTTLHQAKEHKLRIEIYNRLCEMLGNAISISTPIINEINNHKEELKTIHENFNQQKKQAEDKWKQSLSIRESLSKMSDEQQIKWAQNHIIATQQRASYAENGDDYIKYITETQAYEEVIQELVNTLPFDKVPFDYSGDYEQWIQKLLSTYDENTNLVKKSTDEFRNTQEKIQNIQARISALQKDIISLSKENIKELSSIHRKIRNFPQQIFEQDVLTQLDIIKNQYQIPLKDLDNKRILYKEDIELYLQVYILFFQKINIPQNSLICIDEAQDLSTTEYMILTSLQPNATYNLFGDIEQQLYNGIGINNWDNIKIRNLHIHLLEENYRNAAEISKFCSKQCNIKMQAFGCNGYVESISNNVFQLLFPWIEENKNTVAIIAKNETVIALLQLPSSLEDKLHIIDRNTNEPDDSRINIYLLDTVKGLEFPTVFVIDHDLTRQQQYVAYTRAMKKLFRVIL